MHSHAHISSRSTPVPRQRGVVLIITLIAMVIMMVGAVALVRSFNTSLIAAGQLAFKRDLMNRGEIALAAARKALASGALSTEAVREGNLLSANYFATLRSNNDNTQGVPKDLIKDADFTGTLTDISGGNGVTMRYIIERQCNTTGAFSTITCSVFRTPADKSGSEGVKAGGQDEPVYRVTVRVKGPRNTTVYIQSLVSI